MDTVAAVDHSYSGRAASPEADDTVQPERCTCERKSTKLERELKRKLAKERVKVLRLRRTLEEANALIPHVKNENNLNTVIRMVECYLSGPVLNLFVAQLRTVNVHKKQRRWNNELKVICLAIRYQSPKAYRFLRKILCLPNSATLRKPLEGIKLNPGMCLPVFDVLAKKAQTMPDLDKYCTLVLDEMTIKTLLQYEPDRDRISGFADYGNYGTTLEFGNEALVFMVTGIFTNWKQSVSCHF